MMFTPPFYSTHYSKCPPPAAMHFTALAFISNIALRTIAGSIWATFLAMLAGSSFTLAGRGQYTLDLRKPQRQKQSCKISRNLHGSDSSTNFYLKDKFFWCFAWGKSWWTDLICANFVTFYNSVQKSHMDLCKSDNGFLTANGFLIARSYICHSWFSTKPTFFWGTLYLPDLATWPTYLTCDIWDIWSEWWEDMTWPKITNLPTFLPPLENTLKEQS